MQSFADQGCTQTSAEIEKVPCLYITVSYSLQTLPPPYLPPRVNLSVALSSLLRNLANHQNDHAGLPAKAGR